MGHSAGEVIAASDVVHAWSDYTPTLSNWTLSNGTLEGRVWRQGDLVHFSITYTVGSTDTPSGAFAVTLPTTPASQAVDGTARLFDTSAPSTVHRIIRTGAGDLINCTDLSGNLVTASSPWTWATGDIITISGSYEAA